MIPLPIALASPMPGRSIPPFVLPAEEEEAVQLGDAPRVVVARPDDPVPASVQEEIVVRGRARSRDDPLVGINAKSYAVTQAIDDAVLGPVSRTYTKVLPRPIRSGVHNFLSNLHEPVVAINYLLQLKPGKAAETIGRFAVNTTLGVAGLFDAATKRPFRLPFRANGFANTLGYYGVKPGPYIFLPIVGATTPRDFFGLMVDRALHPFSIIGGSPTSGYSLPTGVLHTLDRRSAFEDELAEIRRTDDPYVARRTAYFAKRRAAIERLHGRTGAQVGAQPPDRSDRASLVEEKKSSEAPARTAGVPEAQETMPPQRQEAARIRTPGDYQREGRRDPFSVLIAAGEQARRQPPGHDARRAAMVAAIRRNVAIARSSIDISEIDRVLGVIDAIPREEFVPKPAREFAYLAFPLQIGHGQTISDAYIVAVMTAAVRVRPGDAVLDVGTGSGYQAAVLAGLHASVRSIEIVKPLARDAGRRLRRLGYGNVRVEAGDGFGGVPEGAPYDAIIVAAGTTAVPQPLIDQLRPRGRLVIPIGPTTFAEQLVLVTKSTAGSVSRCSLGPAAFVPFTGRATTTPAEYPTDPLPLCFGAPVT